MENETEMQASTSVQTGLEGMGKEQAQSELLSEVSGKGSSKQPLIEVKTEAVKSLPGQAELKPKAKSTPRKKRADIEDKALAELHESIFNLDTEIQYLDESIRENPAYRLLPLVTTHGRDKGELKEITVKQYRKYMRKDPPAFVVKDGKVRWELFLDQLNISEHGRFEYDQQLKDEIERLSRDVTKLKELRREKSLIKDQLKTQRRTMPKKETLVLVDNPPVFPKKEDSKAIVTTINGLEMTARRNPSFYQVEDDNLETPHFRVRYAKDARKLMNTAAKSYSEDIARARGITPRGRRLTGRKLPRITPKRPKLQR